MHKLKILIIFLSLILSLRFYLFFNNQKEYENGQAISFEATLLSEPQYLGDLQKFSVSLPEGQTVYITASAHPEYKYADRILITGNLTKRVLNSKIIYSLNFPKIEAKITSKSIILAVTSFIRQSVTETFNKNLSSDLSSLLLGIVFGIKTPMSKEFTNQLRLSGVFHVIAASGMNVTMVAGFLSAMFSLFLRRQIALFFSIFGVLFYAFLAGMQPSIMRASLMGILVFSGQILGKQTMAGYSLFLVAFFMLFISPNLIFDVGFQLSFSATFGLLYIRPILGKINKIGVLAKKFPPLEDLLITSSAQIATLPILLATFNTYSAWSIVVNALVLWTVPPLMILGALASVLGMVIPSLGSIFVYLCFPFLLYFQKTVLFFSSLPGALKVENLPFSLVLGYYLLLLAVVVYSIKVNND